LWKTVGNLKLLTSVCCVRKETYGCLGVNAKLLKAITGFLMSVSSSVSPSVCMETIKSDPTGRIFIKFGTWDFFRNSVEKIQVLLK
jgi:hypothetical protein